MRYKAYGSDDYILFAAVLISLVQSAIIIAGLVQGLGVSTDELSIARLRALGKVRVYPAETQSAY